MKILILLHVRKKLSEKINFNIKLGNILFSLMSSDDNRLLTSMFRELDIKEAV